MKQLKYLLILILFVNCVAAQSSPGKNTARILTQTGSARSYGMGECYTGLFDDIDSIYFNPAGTAFINRAQISSMYLKSFSDITYNSINAGLPAGIGYFTIGMLTLDAGDMDVYYLDGTQKKFKAQTDSLYVVSYAKNIGRYFSIGINSKSLESTLIEKYKATASLYDAGILFKTGGNKFSAGISGQNYGSETVRYYQTEEPIPLITRFGLSYKLANNNSKIVFDLARAKDESLKQHLGIEWFFSDGFAIRWGFRSGYDLGAFSAGFGIYSENFNFDFGTCMINQSEMLNKITLLVKFNPVIRKEPVIIEPYIFGKITDTGDAPVSNATVKVIQSGHEITKCKSDKFGIYKTEPLNPGAYEVKYMKMEHGFKTESVTISSEQVRVDMTLIKYKETTSNYIYGKVVDSDNNPLLNVAVSITGLEEENINVNTEIYTNASGAYKSPHLLFGKYKIKFVLTDYIPFEKEFTMTPDNSLKLDLALTGIIKPKKKIKLEY